jgi:glycosyltransferase involved in cell wall biosynthesis
MKLLFFIDTLSAGGKERRLMELMKGLKQEPDIDFELVVMDNNIQYKEVYDLGINIHKIIRKTKKDLSVFGKVYKVCKSYRPDLVHCWDSMSAVYLIPAVKSLNMKFINGMVTDAPEITGIRNKAWLRAQLTFPFSDLVIGNSKAGLAAYNAPSSKSICIPNGFNFKRIKSVEPPLQIREEIGIGTEYVVGMVASLSKYKDYQTYFAAAQLLLTKRNDVTFLALGNDTDSEASKKLIEGSFIKNFKLLGRKANIESFINTMDVCVLATFTEGISNSIMEYMALGKPVVATAGGGTVELVEDTKTGFLVGQSNAVELAEKIETLLNNQDLRNKMGAAGKERVHNHFSIEKMVHEYILNYKKLLNPLSVSPVKGTMVVESN